MSTVNIFQVSLEMWGCLLCVIIGLFSGKRAYEYRGAFQCVWAMILVNGLLLASDSLAYIFRGDARQFSLFITRLSNFLVFFTEDIITLLYVRMAETLIYGADQPGSRRPWGIVARLCIAAALAGILATPFTGFYYYFDSLNNYRRAPGIMLSFAALGVAFVISSVQLFRYRSRLTSNLWNATGASIVTFFICLLVQMGKYGFSLINVGITVVLVLLFMNIWLDEQNRVVQQEIEAMEQSIAELMEMQKPKE